MRAFIKNALATTGLTIITLAVIGTIYGGKFLFISSVFQSLGVNLLVHIGLIFVRKIESKYFIIEILLEIGYVLLILIPAGFLFDWYSSGTPLWMVILMGIIIYMMGCILNIIRINNDIDFINKHLKSRNGRKGDEL